MAKNNSDDKAVSVKRESTHIEFKDRFDPGKDGDWCEIIKDVVAIANSGGGLILVGVRNDGTPSGESVGNVLSIDPADVTNKLAKHTGEQFARIRIREASREGYSIAVLDVSGVTIPMLFTHPGTYDIGGGKQKTAFVKGTVYFRHGAKSEPGNSHDLRDSVERELARTRKSWLSDVRKIVLAPRGDRVSVLPPEVYESYQPGAHPVRIVDDPSAPPLRRVWDDSAYNSPDEIVVGAFKSWRRDRTSYASEADMWTLFGFRKSLSLDVERAECLLESAVNRHAPFFFWATLLSPASLSDFIKRVAKDGKYPAPGMVAKLAYAIGGQAGAELLEYIASNCSYPSVKGGVGKLMDRANSNGRLNLIYGTKVRVGEDVFEVEETTREDLEYLLEVLFADITKPDNKSEIRRIDALLYGPQLDAAPR